MKKKDIPHFQKKLVNWYNNHQRQLPWRESRDPYCIWVSEVMLQQTQVATVIPYYYKFLEKFPNIQSFADADLNTVLKLWEGLGYYARAINFHRAANIVVSEFEGKVPDSFDEFLNLPGVGEYIASAVQSIAFSHPYAVLDGNVKRVAARLYTVNDPVNQSGSHKKFLSIAADLLEPKKSGIFNQAMMELGALVCKPKQPDCSQCPVQKFCRAYNKQLVNEYPKRIKKKRTPLYHVVAGVIQKEGSFLITRRKQDGLLGGLWEFPGGKIEKKEHPEQACIREIKEEVGLNIRIDTHITQIKHAYTHFKIIMDVYLCEYISGRVSLDGPVDYRWIAPIEIQEYPFPKANHKFFPELLKLLDN